MNNEWNHKMNSEKSIQTAIVRLFAGEASPEEVESIKGWLNLSPENRKLYFDLRDVWLASGTQFNADHYNVEQAINQFREKLRQEKLNVARRLVITKIRKYAAIILLVLALPLVYILGRNTPVGQNSYTTISCALGDRTNLILPDSTEVYLNSGSKLTFNNNFTCGEREVILEGEAFFSVTKDKKNPFRVRSSDVEVEVLGTKFNMKAYSDEDNVAVTLSEGSLKITTNDKKSIIEPGQKLIYSHVSKSAELIKHVDTSIESEWKDGRFVFRNETLGDLKPRLERWFDVDIVFADEAIKERRFTGILKRESILEAVSYFGASRYVGYKIEANKITFYSKNIN